MNSKISCKIANHLMNLKLSTMRNLSLIFWLSIHFLIANGQVISGIVNDENGQPLTGVNINEKGSLRGTVSDLDGSYLADSLILVSFL